jgi:hypothetical protein
MRSKVFTSDEVGESINSRFISAAIEFDSTSKDERDLRKWVQHTQPYPINTFPTYLFFSPDGVIVHRCSNAMSAQSFIDMAADALNPDRQFYSLLARFKQGFRDSASLRELATCSIGMAGSGLNEQFVGDYIGVVKDLYSKDNLGFIGKLTRNAEGEGFQIWFNHPDEVNSVMGKDYAQRKIINVIIAEDTNVIAANKKAIEGLVAIATIGDRTFYKPPEKNAPQSKTPDWREIYDGIKGKFGPYYADRVTKWVKMGYYGQRQDWSHYNSAVVRYLQTYAETVAPGELNGYLWDIFRHDKSRKDLQEALHWSKGTLSSRDESVYMFYDTYANLLYKLNNRAEALSQEGKALSLAPEKEKANLQGTLDKMEKGEVTWLE